MVCRGKERTGNGFYARESEGQDGPPPSGAGSDQLTNKNRFSYAFIKTARPINAISR
jgi:hypothetical protein